MDDHYDRFHADLHSALERLSRAQTHLPAHWQSDMGIAIRIVKQIGSACCPDLWSEHDQPEYPKEARRER